MFQKFQQRVLRKVGECIFHSKIVISFLQCAYQKIDQITCAKTLHYKTSSKITSLDQVRVDRRTQVDSEKRSHST